MKESALKTVRPDTWKAEAIQKSARSVKATVRKVTAAEFRIHRCFSYMAYLLYSGTVDLRADVLDIG